MRKTIGKYVRRYLYDKRLGDRRVVAIYRDGVKLWPTLADTICSCVIDVNALSGSIEWAYWLHALAAVQSQCNAECYLKLTAGGRDYMLGSTFGSWYKAAFDGRATITFADDGPLAEYLRIGDTVSIEARIPARKSELFDGEAVCTLPFLTDTCLSVEWHKKQKRRYAGRRFTVTGQASSTVHFGGTCDTSEHKRGRKVRVLPGNTHKWHNAVYNGQMQQGDSSLSISTSPTGSGGGGGVAFLWPPFTKIFRFKIAAVTRHD